MPHVILDNMVIFHISKCGGQYVLDLLDVNGIEYETSSRNTPADPVLYDLNGPRSSHNIPPNEYKDLKYRLCFLRDPVDWYKSFWAYRMQVGWRDDVAIDRLRSDHFCTFISRVIEYYPGGFLKKIYRRYLRACTCWTSVNNIYNGIVSTMAMANGKRLTRDIPPTHETNTNWKKWAIYGKGQEEMIRKLEAGYDICR